MSPVVVNTALLCRNLAGYEELNDDVDSGIVDYVNDFEEKHYPSQAEKHTPTGTANVSPAPVPATTTLSVLSH